MAKRKSILDFVVAYLAGPIDHAADKGKAWRRDFRNGAKDRKIRLVVLDPTNKLKGLTQDVGEEQRKIKQFKEAKDWDGLTDFMTPVVHSDLRQVDLCDLLVLYIDTTVHMCGSYDEARVALNQKKPILAIVKGGKQNAPAWLFGTLDYHYMFDNVEECLDFLDDVNTGKISLDEKWVLIRKQMLKIAQTI